MPNLAILLITVIVAVDSEVTAVPQGYTGAIVTGELSRVTDSQHQLHLRPAALVTVQLPLMQADGVRICCRLHLAIQVWTWVELINITWRLKT